MRFSFGDPDGASGPSQTFVFVEEGNPVAVDLDGYQVEIPVTVTSFGDGTIGYVRLIVYITIPNLADLNVTLVHPAFRPSITAPGMAGYHVVNYVFDRHVSGVADLGQSVSQPVGLVWDIALPSITNYGQDQHGDYRPADDTSTLNGLAMAGTWELWVHDYNGPRAGVIIHYAALQIFDGTVTPPDDPPTPIPAQQLTSDGLVINMDASATSGGVDPLEYFWEVYDSNDIIVGTANGGYPSLYPLATFTVPSAGLYQVSLRVASRTNFAKEYLLQSITVG